MNKLEKMFGIDISIREEVDAENLSAYQDTLERLMRFVDFNLNNYFIYVHFITIKDAKRKNFFGNRYSLEQRINSLTLVYNVNKKQRMNMKFYNEYGQFSYSDGMLQIPEESKVQFIFDSSHIKTGSLETKLITFIKKESIRADHLKIKLEVRPHPTSEFEVLLKRESTQKITPRLKRRLKDHGKNVDQFLPSINIVDNADSFTEVDLYFSKQLKFTIPQLLLAYEESTDRRPSTNAVEFISLHKLEIDKVMDGKWSIRKKDYLGEYELKYAKIRKWFENFDPSEYSIALKLLMNVDFYSSEDIEQFIATISSTLKSVFQYNLDGVYFFGLGDSPSTSGSKLLYGFRKQLKVPESRFPKDVSLIDCSSVRALVFFDDVVGSGKQAADYFNKNLLSLNVDCYYCPLVGFERGLEFIVGNSGFRKVIPGKKISESERVFSDNSRVFPDKEERECAMKVIKSYGEKLYPRGPLGFGDSQSLVVFQHNVPNNTLPVIWANPESEKLPEVPWEPLFPRVKF